jgi:MoxR-like ATPase
MSFFDQKVGDKKEPQKPGPPTPPAPPQAAPAPAQVLQTATPSILPPPPVTQAAPEPLPVTSAQPISAQRLPWVSVPESPRPAEAQPMPTIPTLSQPAALAPDSGKLFRTPQASPSQSKFPSAEAMLGEAAISSEESPTRLTPAPRIEEPARPTPAPRTVDSGANVPAVSMTAAPASSPALRAVEPERRSREMRAATATPVPPPPPIVIPTDPRELEAKYVRFREVFHKIRDEVAKIIVGQREIIEGTLICFLAKGNVLLEGVPGLGKTLLVRTFAQTINASFSRVQFTPDLMPADITGTNIVTESETGHRRLRFQPGPIFAHIVLADEINRATPKTQSALLEAMQEHTVTVGGKIRVLEEPFFVLATQNPVEQEGTYPLPEAQLDRFFFKLIVPFPDLDELYRISTSTTGTTGDTVGRVSSAHEILELREIARVVPIAEAVEKYAARLVMATHAGRGYETEMIKRFVRYGASPRGVQALVIGAKIRALVDGRFSVACEDIRAVAPMVLRHRLILNFEGEAENVSTDAIVKELLAKVPEGDRAR